LEEYTAFIFNSAMNTEATHSSKMVVPLYETAQHHIQGVSNHYNQYHDNYRSHNSPYNVSSFAVVYWLLLSNRYILHSVVHCVVCLVIGPQPPPKWVLQRVWSSASSFKCQYFIFSFRLSSSCLHLFIHPLISSILS
jgi:hypothetical protein